MQKSQHTAKDEQQMTWTRHGLKEAGLETLFLAQTIDAKCLIWTLEKKKSNKLYHITQLDAELLTQNLNAHYF